jgi:hypothetical protein
MPSSSASCLFVGLLIVAVACTPKRRDDAPRPDPATSESEPTPTPTTVPSAAAAIHQGQADVSPRPASDAGSIQGLVEALAIPHEPTGTIEIVLASYPATCAYWTNPAFGQSCDVWRTRIYLPIRAQKPGSYRIEQDFAYLDRKASTPTGPWQSAPHCEGIGGDLRGKIEIDRITKDTIEGRISDVEAGEKDRAARNRGLLRGAFVARRCPACGTTGQACTTNADCCAGNCNGHCRP